MAAAALIRWCRGHGGPLPMRRAWQAPLSTVARPAVLDVSPEVADALHAGRPVVALESTIISHGPCTA